MTMTEPTTVKTGQEAVDHMVDSWKDLYLGMVNTDVIDPWLKVSRAGGDYATYLSLVDGTAVTVDPSWADRDSDEDVPNDLYPDELLSDEQIGLLAKAFNAPSGGQYPLPDKGVFCVSFVDDDNNRRALHVGLLDDTLEIVAG